MTPYQTKKLTHKVYNNKYIGMSVRTSLVDQGYIPAKKSETPIMQMLARQMDLQRRALGVR